MLLFSSQTPSYVPLLETSQVNKIIMYGVCHNITSVKINYLTVATLKYIHTYISVI